MSLLSSLFIGTTGLTANGQDLSVIGDNIANANTIGFKAGRAAFEDILGQNLVIGEGEIGLGVKLQAVQKILTQGALASTGLATDLALQGPGFFVVNTPDGFAYTRAGQFTFDQEGFLVNLDGLRVQGRPADPAGNILGAPGDLMLGDATSPPQATSEIVMQANLDAEAIPPAPFDPLDPAATSNFSTSVTVYDSLGKATEVNVYFRKEADGQWEWHALTDGANVQGGTAGTNTEVAAGTLTFDAEGQLVDSVETVNNFNPIGAVQPQPLNFNFGDPISGGGTGLTGVTQFANPSAVSFLSQDGFPAGELATLRIDEEGNTIGIFTNGQSRVLGQISIASFEAPDQLERAGGNLFRSTEQTGLPNLGTAGSGGRGRIVSGALEASNVDIANEFVRMIVAQRGFQANSKTVTTADQLLGELIQLKR